MRHLVSSRPEITQRRNTIALQTLDALGSNTISPLSFSCSLLLSRIFLERGELDEALKLAETTLARLSVLDRTPMEAEALHLFARIHELIGNHQIAYNAYLRCEQRIARMRRQLTPGYLRTSFLSDKEALYEDVFFLARSVGMAPNQLFEHAEGAKSRTLAELLPQEFRSPWEVARTAESTDLAEAWTSLRASVKRIESLRAAIKPNAAKSIDDLTQRVTAADRATLRLIGSETSAKTWQSPLTAHEIGAALPPRTGLVEFYFSRGTIFAFYIDKFGCELVEVGAVQKVRHLQRLVQFQLRTRPSRAEESNDASALFAYLGELYDLLWLPLLSYVKAPNLVVVPHGFLHQLPFQVLFDGQKFLIDRHSVTYSPSAEVFHATCNRVQEPAGIGSVVVGSSDVKAPLILLEALQVGEMLSNAKVFVDGQATRANLLDELHRANLIHIAAHGAFSPSDPLVSAVRLDDGPLTVKELEELRLHAELVVLSGCDTGKSATKGADDVLGLTQALLQAGARTAVVSLWKIDDESTAKFMRLFYSQLRSNRNPANSLRNAQILHRETHRHPFFWAPFVLVGDPTELSTPI